MIKIECEYTELVDVDKLVENPRNANNHPEKQIDMLAKNIKHQGFRHPIIVSKRSGFICAGHGRLLAAKKIGMSKVPVDYQEFESEADEFRFLIADNKLASLADHDDNLMIEGMEELDLKSSDLELMGLDNFIFPDFEPGSLDDQGQLDQKKFVFMECPHCNERFEKGQARVIED